MKKGIVTISTITFSVVAAILLAATSTCLIGCGGDDDVAAPEEDVVKEEPSDPTPPPPVLPVATDEDHLNKARELVKKVAEMESDIIGKIKGEGRPDTDIVKAVHALYKKEYGFDAGFQNVLYEIHIEENPEEKGLDPHTPTPLLLEYLRLSFKFPNLLKDGLLKKFRESSREGNLSINLDNPKPSLNPEEEED